MHDGTRYIVSNPFSKAIVTRIASDTKFVTKHKINFSSKQLQ